jgi:cell wall-associated NlpC family hydrolase
MSNPIAAVQARIAEIRAAVEPATTTAAGTTSATSAATSGGTSFADALAALTGTTGTTGTGAAAATSIAPGSGVTGQDLVASASAYLGVPYVWGGESLAEGGLDCSGLVQRALADLGVDGVPRVARDQATLGTEVASLDQALPGDLVVLGGGSHIGIYVGNGQMIDAPKPGASVTVRDVYAEPTTIRRILPQAGSATTTAAARSSALAATAAGQNALALLGSGTTSSLTAPLTTSLWGAAS